MISKEQLINEIKQIVESNDGTRLANFIKEMSTNDDYKVFALMEDVYEGEELDTETKIKFELLAMEYRSNNREGTSNFFIRENIPYLLIRSIKEDEEKFFSIINEQDNMQELILDYFKEDPGDALEIWDFLADLPLTRTKILDDEEFIAEKMRQESEFFSRLPSGYEHLISYYNPEFEEYDFKYLQTRYKQYYGDILAEKSQTNLIALQYYLKKNQGLSPVILMQPLSFILRGVKKDNTLINKIDNIAEKTRLGFIPIALLVYKYRDTRLLKELIESEEISSELSEKLKLLSEVNKIKGVNSTEDLNNASISDLENMEREVIYVSNAFGRGGPVARTSIPIFKDSSLREIRRIDNDGTGKKLSVENQEGHDEVVKEIYKGDIKFPDTCTTAFNRSVEAAKQLSSVTLVIESEQCHIYLPSDISYEQSTNCLELIETSIEEGKFGIVVYDREKNKPYIVGIDLLDKEEAKRFIQKAREKAKSKNAELESERH